MKYKEGRTNPRGGEKEKEEEEEEEREMKEERWGVGRDNVKMRENEGKRGVKTKEEPYLIQHLRLARSACSRQRR